VEEGVRDMAEGTTSEPVAMAAGTNDPLLLALVRGVHTAVYLVMVAAILVLLRAGATGYAGPWLWVALVLLAGETLVFVGKGFACPLTALAVRYGAETGHVFDTFLPERVTRYTFRFFGSLMAIGLGLLVLRWIGVLG
jgi:hypothetical protein